MSSCDLIVIELGLVTGEVEERVGGWLVFWSVRVFEPGCGQEGPEA